MPQKAKPIHAGDIYKELTAIKFDRRNPKKPYPSEDFWIWRCYCGKEFSARVANIKFGNTNSCGCYNLQSLQQNRKTHGMANDNCPIYKCWKNMRNRCLNSNAINYKDYGGRGISICERWDNFELFKLDMGSKPEGDYSIDRKDVNGNYEPDNCRWASRFIQNNNKQIPTKVGKLLLQD